MSNDLFREFEAVSAKEWKQKIQVDLKGADYNETLIWQSLEGINVKPFYHPDDFSGILPPIPGHPKSWNVAQDIFIDSEKIANNLALDAVNRGAESIIFSSEKEFDPIMVFQDFPFEKASVYFKFSFLSTSFFSLLNNFLKDKNATVFYNIDIVGNLAKSGNWFFNLKEDYKALDQILSEQPNGNIIGIDATLYQNAGANMVQQLAYALSHANEYLNHLHNNDFSKENKTPLNVTFTLAIGSNYFFEIAKILALRKLYALLAKEYNLDETCHILAVPSKRNKTIYDYNVNMLRTTTECMSAVLGGANTISNLAYDNVYHKSNEFGERISRNQLLILKAESYFDTVSNAADGTYYIESLTSQLAEKALTLFKEIEKSGGFLSALKEGIIQRKIKDSAKKEQSMFDEGKLKLLGTNFHQNKEEKMGDDIQLFPFIKSNPRKTLIEPIIEKRLAEKTEQQRLNTEKL